MERRTNNNVLKRIIVLLKRHDYDYDSPNFTLHHFHPQLAIYYFLNGILFNHNKDSPFRFIVPVFFASLTLAGFGMELIMVVHSVNVKDYALASASFCYVVIIGVVPIIYASILKNKDIIIDLIQHMQKDFLYIRALSSEYRDRFIEVQLIIYAGFWIWLAFCTLASMSYIGQNSIIVVYQTLLGAQDEFYQRRLMFPLWLPYDDPYRTPNYEIFYAMETMIVLIVNQTFGGYVATTFHFLLHYYNILDLMSLDLMHLFDGLDQSVVHLARGNPRRETVQAELNRRMKRIVDWHNEVFYALETVSSIYGPPLAYQVFFSPLVICILGYETVYQLENGSFDVLFLALFFESLIQLWLPCYFGNLIYDKAQSIADACWSSEWSGNALGTLVRTDFTILILRAQRPLLIKFAILPGINLETYSSILSTAYTYFNMLRRTTS